MSGLIVIVGRGGLGMSFRFKIMYVERAHICIDRSGLIWAFNDCFSLVRD